MRCNICDYTEEYGSALTDTAPNKNITVRFRKAYNGFLCTTCSNEIRDNLSDLSREGDASEAAHTLPVWEEQ